MRPGSARSACSPVPRRHGKRRAARAPIGSTPGRKFWHDWASTAFLQSYLQQAANASFLPRTERELQVLLAASLIDRGLHDLGYQLHRRVRDIPATVAGLLDAMAALGGSRALTGCGADDGAGCEEWTMRAFRDRHDAGRQLAERLTGYAGRSDVLVLALPRGGVPVASEVAATLDVPLDVFLVRKLGVPGQEELAMGAIASGEVQVLNEHVVEMVGVSEEEIDRVAAREQEELERREREYRNGRRPPEIRGRTVILIDDGLATGSTMRAAVQAVRRQGASQVVVAVPVAAASTCDEFRDEVDDVVCAVTPEPFYAVGLWYEDFSQTTDEEVRRLLEQSARGRSETARR